MKLLIGVGHEPAAAELMRRYGFGEDDRREGWQRLSEAAAARSPRRAAARPGERLLERLDAWQEIWFPVASTQLRERFPAVHAWLFRNLPQSGPSVSASVGLFVQRLWRMPFEPALGPQGAEARELLARRGIDAQTVRIASDLLELISTVPPAGSLTMDGAPAELAAEDALWSWYRHWSEIARVAISDRELLRELGFGGS